LFLDAHLSLTAGGPLASFPFAFTFPLILFYLSQSEYCPEPFIINNLPLIDTGQLIECLTLKAPMSVVEGEGAIGIIQHSGIRGLNAGNTFQTHFFD
jgi:hypothetical protein